MENKSSNLYCQENETIYLHFFRRSRAIFNYDKSAIACFPRQIDYLKCTMLLDVHWCGARGKLEFPSCQWQCNTGQKLATLFLSLLCFNETVIQCAYYSQRYDKKYTASLLCEIRSFQCSSNVTELHRIQEFQSLMQMANVLVNREFLSAGKEFNRNVSNGGVRDWI